MISGQVRLGRILGIEVGLHYSWFLIAALLTMSLAGHLVGVNRDWRPAIVWTAATVAAIAFFASILLHELSHAAVARAWGIPVHSITLFALGGVAQMRGGAKEARSEMWIAIAGPIVSVAIGATALGLASLLGWNYDVTPRTPGMAMLVWFGFINLTLAAFNMIPGFPLDGGRVLRAIIWWWSGNQMRATRIASTIGQVVAVAFIFVGVSSIMRGNGLGGVWLSIIGLFLSGAARAEAFQATALESLRGVRVGDVMSRDCATVERGRTVSDLAAEVLRTGRRLFFVVEDGHVAGLVTPRELRAVPRDRWLVTPVSQAMQPAEHLHPVAPDTPVTEALDEIGRAAVSQLPVVDHGQLRGVISRDQIVGLLSARAELAA